MEELIELYLVALQSEIIDIDKDKPWCKSVLAKLGLHADKKLINGGKGQYTTAVTDKKKRVPKRF